MSDLPVAASTHRHYDTLAAQYRAIESDWDAWMTLNNRTMRALVAEAGGGVRTALDCAAGVGSQAIALAELGLDVHASDLSVLALEQLSQKSSIPTQVCSWVDLPFVFPDAAFDMVVCMDNAIGHTPDETALLEGIAGMVAVTSATGARSIFISTRDFDALGERQPPGFPEDGGPESRYYQRWEWTSRSTYRATWFIHGEEQSTAEMRCISRRELRHIAERLGLRIQEIRTAYRQPIYRFY